MSADRDSTDVPDVGELLALVEQLDADNERLRMRVLEVMEWMEESVTAQVAAERELDRCRHELEEVAQHLEAIHRTHTWRLLALPRRWYGRLLSRVRGNRP